MRLIRTAPRKVCDPSLSFQILLIILLTFPLQSTFGFPLIEKRQGELDVCPSPTFLQLRSYFLEARLAPGLVEAADLNGDGRLDLYAAETLTGSYTTLTVMLGVGSDGGFAEEVHFPIGGQPKGLASGDINGDGKLDIIVTHFNQIDILLGDGLGSFAPAIIYHPNGVPIGFIDHSVVRDLNGDGLADLVITAESNPGMLMIRFGNGDGTFVNGQTLLANNAELMFVFAEDINNDGILDLIATDDEDSPMRVFIGTGNGTYANPTTGPNLPPGRLKFSDRNGDGFKDIVAVRGDVHVLINNGLGGFVRQSRTPLEMPQGTSVSRGLAEDLDGDGILDLIVATNYPDLRIYKGISSTTFGPPQFVPIEYYAYNPITADLNADGMPDLVIPGYDTSNIYTLINKCGMTTPRYSIFGSIVQTDQFVVNGARIKLESDALGASYVIGSTLDGFSFRDLPAGSDSSVVPTHSLFEFSPWSQSVKDISSDRNIQFASTVRRFSISGRVFVSGSSGLPAAGMEMRLVGPFGTNITTTTDAGGNYYFRDLYPITANDIYQIQFLSNPIFQAATPVYAIRGLLNDRIQNFTAGRHRYDFGVRVVNANGTPRIGLRYYLVQPFNWPDLYFDTDADGRGQIQDLPAGLPHQIYDTVPSYRFSPRWPSTAFLSGDTEISVRVSRRNQSDFDDDGLSDVAVWRPSNGVWYISNSDSNDFTVVRFGLPTDIPVTADFDGDEKVDLTVFRPSDGTWHSISSSTFTYSINQFGTDGDVPVATDFDRDGKTDLSVYRPSSGVWYHRNSYWNTVEAYRWGLAEDQPLTGDFDGDTYNDRVAYRPSSQVWYIQTGSWTRAIKFGLPEDMVMVGDFDGDTVSDIAAWRPSTGTWYIFSLTNDTYKVIQFGTAGDMPLSGDFDGDGIDDVAVFRPSEGTWHVSRSSDESYSVTQFGLEGDIPIQSLRVR